MTDVRIDYLSVRLNPQFTFTDWWNVSQKPLTDKDTGEVFGVTIPTQNWRLGRSGKYQVVSTWGIYSQRLAAIAMVEELDITRLDLCIDTKARDYDEAENLCEALNRRIHTTYLERKRSIAETSFKGQSRDGSKNATFLFGNRRSPYQIRIYTADRSGSDGYHYRTEFQLRGKLAKSVWATIRERYGSKKRLTEAMASIEAKVLKPGVLGQKWDSSTLHEINYSDYSPPSNRENWIRTQVLSACIKEFNETGRNLPAILLADFNQHFEALAQSNIEHNKIESEVKAHKRGRPKKIALTD